MRAKGFSLIELVMVIVIIAILAAFAVPFWTSASLSVDSQANQLAGDIMYTQSLALASGQRYYLIQMSSKTYQIRNGSGTAIAYPGTGNTTITLASGITFGTLVNLPNNLVEFDGDGIPYSTTSTPGTPLSSAAQIPVTGFGATKTATITPRTGWVQLS